MARKVFISFLGTSTYDETYYYDNDKDKKAVEPTRFIQVATLSRYASHFSKDDKIYIFTTEGSLENWNDNQHFNTKTKKEIYYDGLNRCISDLNLSAPFENVMISDGKSTDEIWQIFQKVFDIIEDNDELIFDITHGFRSLPMLNMVLINYAKLLRNISVSGIYYGAFDAKEDIEGKTFSPIWNLIDFEKLQEWTNVANIFINTGNGIKLAGLINDSSNQNLKEGLINLSKSILVNRGMKIISGEEIISLRDAIKKIEDRELTPKETPLKPILERIRHKFDDYQLNHPINGFLAAKWALENGLVQQAATLMEESVTTFILFELAQENQLGNSDIRNSVSSALSIGNEQHFRFQEIRPQQDGEKQKEVEQRVYLLEVRTWQEEFVPQIRMLPYKIDLGIIITRIKNSIRNDVNHAGFRPSPRTYDEFQESLKKRYQELRKLFTKINKFELPPLNL